MPGQLGLLLGVLDEDKGGMGEVLLGVGIVEEALGSGIVPRGTLEDDIAGEDILTEDGIAEEDILTEDGIAAGLDDIVGMEESIQETPVGYSKYNNYVKPK